MQLSLIMATIGRVQEPERFVASLAGQTCRDFELIVVDQNPDERLAPAIVAARSLGIEVTHLRQAEPNLSTARNTGLACARHEVVAFPDDDCWYEPEVVELVLARMAAGDAPDGILARWAEQDPVGRPAYWLSSERWRQFREADASSITQFLRRDLVVDIRGFDSALGVHSWFGGGEETDLMFRIMAAGAKVAYVPNILVHHPFHATPIGSAAAVFRSNCKRARGTGALYAKHRLAFWVIGRGLLTPWARTVLNLHRPVVAAMHLGVALGRVEGYLRWPR